MTYSKKYRLMFRHPLVYLKTRRDRKRFERAVGRIGDHSGVGDVGCGDGCKLQGEGSIVIGERTWINAGCELLSYSPQARITIGDGCLAMARFRVTAACGVAIGDHVLIAPDVFITDHNHGMNPMVAEGYAHQPLTARPVVIKDGVWLGQRVCVLPGVTVGAHSIIGANSVVTHDIPDFSIAGGVPARVIKTWDFAKNEWVRKM